MNMERDGSETGTAMGTGMDMDPGTERDLPHRIAAQISDGILAGRHAPGERLNELQLSRELGTSRAPVREAARLLEAQGLVISHPRRGFFVRTLTAPQLYDMYDLRLALEIHAAGQALERIGEVDMDRLRRQVELLHGLARSARPAEQVAADYAFHRMLASLSGNGRLLKVLDDIALDMRAGIAVIGRLYDDPARIARNHDPILEALEARDPHRLAAALRFHIGEARDRVVPLFSSLPT